MHDAALRTYRAAAAASNNSSVVVVGDHQVRGRGGVARCWVVGALSPRCSEKVRSNSYVLYPALITAPK